MLKIQNLACIPLTITADDNVIPIIKDILRNRKVNAIYLFSSTEDVAITSPYSDQNLTSSADIDDLNLFINVTDDDGHQILNDLASKNITLKTELKQYIELPIDKVLDLDKCFINSKSVIVDPVYLLIYVLYQTDHFTPYTDEVNGSITVSIPVTSVIEDIKLSDYIDNSLKNRKIKKIHIHSSDVNQGYLDLLSKNKKRHLENIPLQILRYFEPKSFSIDPMEIDFENSFLRVRDPNLTVDHFKITFIY